MTLDTKTKTEKALGWISAAPAGEARTVYAAAKKFDVTPSVLYRARSARKGRQICPTCGQLMPRGQRLPHPHR